MKKWLKAFGTVVAVLASCLLIAVGCLLGYAHTDHFRNTLLKVVNASITGRLSLEGHDISLLRGRIALTKPALDDRQGRHLASMDRLMVEVAFWPLLNRIVVVESVHLEKPDIRLSITAGGRIDIAEAFQPTTPKQEAPASKATGRPFHLIVRRASISDGRINFIDPSKGLEAALNRITLQARADLFNRTGAIQLDVGSTVLAREAQRTQIEPLSLSLERKEDRPVSVTFGAATDFARVDLSGTVQPVWPDPDLTLKVDLTCSLAELNDLLKLPVALTGRATGQLHLDGDWRNPAADLHLAYDGGSLAGYRVDKLLAQLRLQDRLLTLDRLDVQVGSGTIGLTGQAGFKEVFPQGVSSAHMDLDRLAYQARAVVKDLDLVWLARGTDGIQGSLNAGISLSGTGVAAKTRRATGLVDLELNRFMVNGMNRPTDLQLQTALGAEAEVVRLNRSTLSAAGIRLDGRGTLDTASGEVLGQLEAETGDLGNLLSLFGADGGEGACRVKVDLSGPWRLPQAAIQVDAQQIRFHQTRVGEVDLSAILDGSGLLHISGLNLSNRGSRIQASGKVQLLDEDRRLHPAMPLQAKLRVIDGRIGDFKENLGVSGTFEGEILLEGNVDSLEILAEVHGSSVAYGNIRLGEVDAGIRFLDGELVVDRLRLEREDAALTIRGGIRAFQPNSWSRLADPVLNLNVAGDVTSLADMLSNIRGRLTLNAHLEGPASDLKGRGRIEAQDLDVYGQTAQRLSLDMELKENRLQVPALEAVIDAESKVTGFGWVSLDRRFSFELFSKGLSLDSIHSIRELKDVHGKADLRLRGEGAFDDPGIRGEVHVKEVRIKREDMDDFSFQIDLAHHRLSVKGRQTFDLDLSYHLQDKAFNVDLHFAETELAPFFLIAGIKDFGGALSGRVRARGNTTALKESEALVDLSSLSLTFGDELCAEADVIRAELDHQRLSVPEFQLKFLRSGVLRIQGSGNLDGHVGLSAEGSIPANTARLFLQDVLDIQGDIHLQAEMKGTLSEPEWSGEIVFQDVGFALPQSVSAFKGINGRIAMNADRISIANLQGNMDTGTFLLSGDAALENFRLGKIDLKLNGNRLPVIIPETMEVLLATDLTAVGTMDRLRIEGDVVILEGLYYKNFKVNLLRKMKDKKRPAAPSADTSDKSFLDRIAVDIKLKYRQPFTVDNNIAYLEIQPDLALAGTLKNPVVSGIAKVEEGVLSYQNKSFVVEKGVIGFANPYQTEAEIDIVGSIRVRQWWISLSLSGTPDRLEMELSSVPQEDDADIVSLLVFGKTTHEMSGGSGTLDSTEALMAQLMASSFGEDIKKATGLDYLEVKTENGEMEDESDTVKVTVGKDLTERLTVKYTIGSGTEGYDQRAATEYKLLEHILLGGFQDIKGSYGGEIIFRFEFR